MKETEDKRLYPELMGLNTDTADLSGKSVLEINNAPNALSLKFPGGKRKLISSTQHPAWMIQMYQGTGIELQIGEIQDMLEQDWDEVWVINALQDAKDIERALFNIKHSGKALRVYQPLDERITRGIMDAGLGIFGAVTTLTDGINQTQIYYGAYNLGNGEKLPLRPNMQFWGGNIDRAMLRYIKQYHNTEPLVMAEIGVFLGLNAKFILDNLNIRHLYLIDPYQQYNTDIYSQADLDRAKASARNLLLPYKDKITWLYVRSLDAVKILRGWNVELDAAYYDGDHSYVATYGNIGAYDPITRLCIGGHDFIPDIDNLNSKYGVMSAVCKWTHEHKRNFFCSEFPFSDWWIDKTIGRK